MWFHGFSDLDDMRLLQRGNQILKQLFSKCSRSIRQLSDGEAEAKAFYRFLKNDRVSEDDIVMNLADNCRSASKGKYVVCIQDTTEVNLIQHRNRLKRDEYVGTTNANKDGGLGFFLHPSLVLDAVEGTPYGYADIKVWNRSLQFSSKFDRRYNQLSIKEKESYKWLEVSNNTKAALSCSVAGMVIVQDREGDIYEQFALIPDEKTDLLVRARTNRMLTDNTKLFSCLAGTPAQGTYEVMVAASPAKKRKKRVAQIEVRYKEVEIRRTDATSKGVQPTTRLYLIEAMETGYNGKDKICWRLLSSIPVMSIEMARICIEWYSWRWMVEEVFKILKKEGFDIEASELESAAAIRKLSLMIMEVVIKLFLMRLAYAEPELEISAESCFSASEQEFMEHQINRLEGKTEKQKNPYKKKDLKRYVWVIARLGGWKGYESKRIPGITTLWVGLGYFKAAMQGWEIRQFVSTR
jgi:Transposase DNA-binding